MKSRALGLGLAVLVSASMWFYVQRIQVRYQIRDAAIHGQPRGNFSDLYPRWLGTKELLLHNRNPYSPEVTREIQEGYYGRALDSNRTSDPQDQQGFAYPLYIVFLLAPFIYLPFHTVQVVAFWVLLLATAVSVPLWVRASNWKPSGWTIAILMVLMLGCFPVVQALKLQQLTLFVAALLAASFVLLLNGRFVWAGVLLAVCTIKPQLMVLLVVWFFFWTFGDWKNRWRFAAAFAGTLAVLIACAQFVLPGWVPAFLQALRAYREYTGGAESYLEVLFTPLIGRMIGGLLILFSLALSWRFRKVKPESSTFFLVTSFTLAITITALTKVAPYNQVLLLPAILFMLQHRVPFKTLSRFSQWLMAVSAVALMWPWVASVGLCVFSIFLPAEIILRGWMVPLYTSIAIPPTIFALLVPHVLAKLRAGSQPGNLA